MGLRFCVLGPLEVRVDGRVLPLGAAKQRHLLAALLVNANEAVSAERLVDVLWPDNPPGDAVATVAKYVYRLRAALAGGKPAVVLTRPGGYLLAVESDQVDAGQFAALTAEARKWADSEPIRALAKFDEALALWRGPAWAEFADQDFVRAEAARLAELRAVAIEDRFDLMLSLGRQELVVGELQQAVERYPLRERPRAQLMLALYRGGRQAEALEVYQSFRRYLLDEMGLEPSAALRTLQQDMLRQERGLNLPSG